MKEVIRKILKNHTNSDNVGIRKYEFEDIEITVNQINNKVTIWAFNHRTDRFINLGTKKWTKLIDGFRAVSKDLYSNGDKYYIELKDNKNNGVKSIINKKIGYVRVSTKGQLDGNSIEEQGSKILERYPTARIVEESYSGTKDRGIFNNVLEQLQSGDTLIVTKLDRFCRTTKEGLQYIDLLMDKGVKIHILNMGLIEDTPMGRVIVTNLLAFAEFERAMIIERTKSGKAIARTKEGFKEGRPKEYTQHQLDSALKMLTVNGGDSSYTEVVRLTQISKSTLIREQRKQNLNSVDKTKEKVDEEDIIK
ncbi:MAG: recombinase family protein [Cetobacterium sp.]